MVMARWQATITDDQGNVVPEPELEVRRELPGLPLAQIFSDRVGETQLSNPHAFTGALDGYVAFHAAGGVYRITARKGGFERTWPYVGIGLGQETDITGFRPAGAWDAEEHYTFGSLVLFNGRLFASAAGENAGNQPPNEPASNAYWMYVPLPQGERGFSFEPTDIVAAIGDRDAFDAGPVYIEFPPDSGLLRRRAVLVESDATNGGLPTLYFLEEAAEGENPAVWSGGITFSPAMEAFIATFEFEGDGTTDTFDLAAQVPAVASIEAPARVIWFEDGIWQHPGVHFTVSGTEITRAEPPAAGAKIYGAVHLPFRLIELHSPGAKQSVEQHQGDFRLVNDAAIPGPAKVYATNEQGVRGWHPLEESVYMPIVPGLRAALDAGDPAARNSIEDAEAVHYVPHVHNRAALYDGERWRVYAIGSALTQLLSDNTKSPAAAAADKLYDLFLWRDEEGTIFCTRGPFWAAGAERGTGPGSTELVRQDGVWVNKYDIQNGPGAGRGVYVGTIATNGEGKLDMMTGFYVAVGGADNRLGLWNMYNRVLVESQNQESGSEWSYNGTTIRPKRNSTANRITLVRGLDEDAVDCWSGVRCDTDSGTSVRTGIGLDSTDTFSHLSTTPEYTRQSGSSGSQDLTGDARLRGRIGPGLHYLQALEVGSGTGTTLWRDRFQYAGTENDRNRQGMNLLAWM